MVLDVILQSLDFPETVLCEATDPALHPEGFHDRGHGAGMRDIVGSGRQPYIAFHANLAEIADLAGYDDQTRGSLQLPVDLVAGSSLIVNFGEVGESVIYAGERKTAAAADEVPRTVS